MEKVTGFLSFDKHYFITEEECIEHEKITHFNNTVNSPENLYVILIKRTFKCEGFPTTVEANLSEIYTFSDLIAYLFEKTKHEDWKQQITELKLFKQSGKINYQIVQFDYYFNMFVMRVR